MPFRLNEACGIFLISCWETQDASFAHLPKLACGVASMMLLVSYTFNTMSSIHLPLSIHFLLLLIPLRKTHSWNETRISFRNNLRKFPNGFAPLKVKYLS